MSFHQELLFEVRHKGTVLDLGIWVLCKLIENELAVQGQHLPHFCRLKQHCPSKIDLRVKMSTLCEMKNCEVASSFDSKDVTSAKESLQARAYTSAVA